MYTYTWGPWMPKKHDQEWYIHMHTSVCGIDEVYELFVSCFLSHFFAGIIHRCHRLFRSTFFAAPSSHSAVKPVISEWIVAISEWIEPCSDIADFISTLAAVAAMVESGDLLDGKWGLATFPVFPPQTYTKQTKQTELPGRCRPCKLILGGTWGYFPVTCILLESRLLGSWRVDAEKHGNFSQCLPCLTPVVEADSARRTPSSIVRHCGQEVFFVAPFETNPAIIIEWVLVG